jgi:predicted DCC family thiol-disulfide oxidoreductase YuxK
MQSQTGRALMARAGLSHKDPDSVILVEGERIEYGARAVLATLGFMMPPWRWLAIAGKLPIGLLERPYRLLARHRHRFGKPTRCAVAEPGRVLD